MKVYYFDQTHILILTHVLTIACESCDKYVPFSSSGQIADRVNLRYFLTVGMIGMHCMFTYVVYICTHVLVGMIGILYTYVPANYNFYSTCNMWLQSAIVLFLLGLRTMVLVLHKKTAETLWGMLQILDRPS